MDSTQVWYSSFSTLLTIVLEGCISQYTRLLYWRDAYTRLCIGGMHTLDFVLEGCISQYTRLLYWRDASHNTLDYCIGGMHTLDYCIRRIHLTIH